VPGHLFGTDEERGVFKTTDGAHLEEGEVCRQRSVHDIAMDPQTAHLYAEVISAGQRLLLRRRRSGSRFGRRKMPAGRGRSSQNGLPRELSGSRSMYPDKPTLSTRRFSREAERFHDRNQLPAQAKHAVPAAVQCWGRGQACGRGFDCATRRPNGIAATGAVAKNRSPPPNRHEAAYSVRKQGASGL